MKHDPLRKGPVNKGSPKKGPPPKRPEKEDGMKRYYDLGALAIIILLGIIIYSNSFSCSFHFDDDVHIVENLKIRDLSNMSAIWGYSPNRPVAMLTFALNYHFNQLNVGGYHVVNLLIHLLNACLVWWLTILILSSPVMKNHELSGNKKLLAFVTALLFVSHPLATQSVTYIIQRMTSLVALFYLLSVVLYMKARISEKGFPIKILLFAGSVLSAILAMFTKENAFTLPFAVLLVELFFIRTKNLSINLKDYRVILSIAAFLAAVLIIPLTRSFSVFDPIPVEGIHGYTLTPFNYLLTQFSVVLKYIQLLILPVNLNVDYDYPISSGFFEIRTLLCFLVLLALIVLAVYLFRKHRVISFGIFWFFLTISIESSIIPIKDVIFEHRTYLPSFGFFIILTTLTSWLYRGNYKTLAIVIWVVIIGSNSWLTYKRNKIWNNEISLWSDNIMKSPGKARPLISRGTAYEDLEQWDKAIEDLTLAIQIDPIQQLAYTNRGFAYKNLGKIDMAIADYSKAVEINPGHDLSWSNRGSAYYALGQYEKAIADFSKAIELKPDYTDAYSNRCAAYGAIGKWDSALADISVAIRLNPGYANAYSNRGGIYWTLNQPDKAISDYTRAIGLNPKFSEAYSNRGFVYEHTNKWEKAIEDYTRVIELDPENPEGYYTRALTYGNQKLWDQAIADYTTAIRLAPAFKQALVNRGVAYWNLGEANKAIEDYNSALRIDPDFGVARANLEYATRSSKNR